MGIARSSAAIAGLGMAALAAEERASAMANVNPAVPIITWRRDTKPHETSGAICSRMGSALLDRKSTRLNSSHQIISYAVFCLKKKIQCYQRGHVKLFARVADTG